MCVLCIVLKLALKLKPIVTGVPMDKLSEIMWTSSSIHFDTLNYHPSFMKRIA